MTTATTFQAGDVVPNWVGLPVTITGIGDGYYESAYGGTWVAQSADDGTVYLLSLIHIYCSNACKQRAARQRRAEPERVA